MRIGVLGLGAISAWGAGRDAHRQGQERDGTACTEGASHRSEGALSGQVLGERSLWRSLPGSKDLRPSTMTRTVWLSSISVGLTLADAGVLHPQRDEALGYFCGSRTNVPKLDRHLRYWQKVAQDSDEFGLDPERVGSASKLFGSFEFLRLMNSMPGAHGAIQACAGGPVATLLGGSLAGGQALCRGLDALTSGAVERALVGGVGAAVGEYGLLWGDVHKAWCPATGVCSPWTQDSDGTFPGEGAAHLLLGPTEDGPELAAWAEGWTGGPQGARVLAEHVVGEALAMAGVAPDEVDAVLGGSGVWSWDRWELEALQELGLARVPRWSLAPLVGWCDGASFLQAVVSAMVWLEGAPPWGQSDARTLLVLGRAPEGQAVSVVLRA